MNFIRINLRFRNLKELTLDNNKIRFLCNNLLLPSLVTLSLNVWRRDKEQGGTRDKGGTRE
jgi:hypothetical protein